MATEKPWKDTLVFFPPSRRHVMVGVVDQIENIELSASIEIEDKEVGSLEYDIHPSYVYPTYFCVVERVFTEMSAEFQELGGWEFEHELVYHRTYEIRSADDAYWFDVATTDTFSKFKRWINNSYGLMTHTPWRLA